VIAALHSIEADLRRELLLMQSAYFGLRAEVGKRPQLDDWRHSIERCERIATALADVTEGRWPSIDVDDTEPG